MEILFGFACLVIAYCLFALHRKNIALKKDVGTLAAVLEAHSRVYKELLNLHVGLQETQTLHTKGFETVIKDAQLSKAEFQDFKQQVLDAFVILTEHFEGVPTVNGPLSLGLKGKIKLN